jgi:Fe-S cluster biogenesis protein NfuA/nitrite reductase/ring-hydroxylating ferredoxin subunit
MTATDVGRADAAADETFETLAGAVDRAAVVVEALDPPARRAALELRAAVEAAHRGALVTIVRRLRADAAGRELLYDLVDDPLIHLLLSLHGIIRPDPLTHGRAVLDSVRPGLQSHGGDVELVSVDDGTARVRLSGACKGCSMASVTMRTSVEQALLAGVPAIVAVEVLAEEPGPAIIPLSSVRMREQDPPQAAELGWVDAGPLEAVPDGKITAMSLPAPSAKSRDVIVVRVGAVLSVYLNACAHQGRALDDALLDVTAGTLTCRWHGFSYDAYSGDCMSAPGAALEQLPLRVDRGHIWIRVNG